MNKNAIKKFAIEARKKLIASVTDKAGMLGISAEGVSAPTTKGNDFEVYQTVAGTEVTLNKSQCEQRRRLVEQIEAKGFEEVVEEVAYTWFNRICAIRFMEVNDYLPSRVRVLSSEKSGKNEPDLVTQALYVDLDLTDKEKEFVIEAKMAGKLDELFAMLFIKQCNKLHEVLPKLFEETSDYTEMLLSISFTNNDDVVRMLIDEVPEEDFNITTKDADGNPGGQVEIIGWLYQYYNTEPKADVFGRPSGTKIRKEDVPAATQLFTPDWIVRYMAENSLGRLWVEGHPNDTLKANWKYYLEEAEQESEVQQKLTEIRKEYAALKPEDLKCIDPCMGSGHILVYLFDVLMQIYESQGYSSRDAAQSILQNNLYGLDIDERAAQLSYFAVMMKARQYDRRILTRGIEPHVYAIEESNGFNRNQLKYFGADLSEIEKNSAINQVQGLLDQLHDAKEYGSMLTIDNYDWELLHRFAEKTSVIGQMTFDAVGIDGTQELLKQLVSVGQALAQHYSTVVTNPPYMAVSNASVKVQNYIKRKFPESKTDMFAVFIERCLEYTNKFCYFAMITQHAWMFLSSYEKLRGKLQTVDTVNMAHLGARAFEEIGGEVVQTTSFVMRKSFILHYKSKYERLVDYSSEKSKKENFSNSETEYIACQDQYKKIVGVPVAYWLTPEAFQGFEKDTLEQVVSASVGIQTGDNEKFIRLWWEVDFNNIFFDARNVEESYQLRKWFPYNKGGEYRKWAGNDYFVVHWNNDGEAVKKNSLITGHHYQQYSDEFKFKPLITWSRISTGIPAFRYKSFGYLSDMAGFCLYSKNCDLKQVLAFCNSNVASYYLSVLAPTLNIMTGQVLALPFDSTMILESGKAVDKCIKYATEDWNTREISWNYRNSLVKRKGTLSELWEEWKEESDKRFELLKESEETINQFYIDEYNLNSILNAKIPDSDISVRHANQITDMKELISYAVGCMLGRYSLDVDGLAYAGGKWDSSKYTTFIPDEDNVIPITDDEYFDDDIVGLFCGWLKKVFGEDSLEANLDFIAQALGNKGDTSREVLRNYFLNDFFKDHCNTYSVTGSGKRPIYWLFDSGKENGFKALIYMHRYTSDTVGIVRTEYLHKTQKAIEQAMQRAEYTRDNASSASDKKKAVQQITKYTKQLAQMKSYDEAMAHIANQRIEIDLDDGVKVNYAKFQGVEVAQEGKKALKIDLLSKIK